MLKQEAYEKVSEVFGTVVGVAKMIGATDLENFKEVPEVVTHKRFSDEIVINDIINEAIDYGLYKELQKNLYILNKKRSPRIKESTIYKRAWELSKKNG
ncbi:hypothetical protein UFOVP449_47 [uncultured Caudovirales phage]|uniref:Uncharacterized protein n=1 Tax=uncultured Caudovirales phage TaxID=2100421 RepID=A0A6J5MBA3_9CAUD|nr:hypothetical protein UFOVP449_47 [uncultured Caudovirales phage]